MLKDANDDSICLPNVDSDTFNDLLQFVYTIKEPTFNSTDLERATLLLKAADRFGVTQLKLRVESEIVSKMMLATTSIASLMILAHAHTCALLKEASFKKYFKDTKNVRESEDWSMMKESPDLLDELLQFELLLRQQRIDEENGQVSDETIISVGTLREYLQ
jgi:hypothetical protein